MDALLGYLHYARECEYLSRKSPSQRSQGKSLNLTFHQAASDVSQRLLYPNPRPARHRIDVCTQPRTLA